MAHHPQMIKKLIWLALILLAGCSRDYMSLAKVNGDSISMKDFRLRLKEIDFDPKLVAEDEVLSLKKTILNEMIEEKLIQQEGRKLSVKITEEEVKASTNIEHLDETLAKQKIDKAYWIERMSQKLLAEKVFQEITKTAAIPENEIQDYFDKNAKQFQQQEQVKVIQISMQDRKQADEAMNEISQGKDFIEIAQKYTGNTNLNAEEGAIFIPRGVLPENLEKKVFSLKVGGVTPVIESENEFYIIKVLARKEERPLLWEEARHQIQTMLLQKAKETLYTQWLQEKTIQSNIKRNYELLQENIHP